MGLVEHGPRVGHSLVDRGVLREGVDVRLDDGPAAGHAEADVLGVAGCDVGPAGIVEGAAVDAYHAREALEAQVELGPAVGAEVDEEAIAAPKTCS
jgi:hypothetical protein